MKLFLTTLRIKRLSWLNLFFIFFFYITIENNISYGMLANPTAYSAPNNENKFLSFADIHFDPFTTCLPNRSCPLIDKLQKSSVKHWDNILKQYDTAFVKAGQDSNYSLLISSMNAIQKNANQSHVKFALVLGDYLGHHFKEKYFKYAHDHRPYAYQEFVNKTMEFLRDKIQHALTNINVYPVIGNNDTYGDHYTIDPQKGPFFKTMATILGPLINDKTQRENMQSTFSIGGYYAVTLVQKSPLRLIVLNSVLFSPQAKGKDLENATKKQLDWFHHELLSARAHHQKVLIAMHIPIAIDTFESLQSQPFSIVSFTTEAIKKRFQSELDDFFPEVVALLTAHVHMDWFQLMRLNAEKTVVMSATPGISPLFGNNPAFKIYAYDASSLTLNNFVSYFYSLANHHWQFEYDFNHVYQPNCINSCTLLHGMQRLAQSGMLTDAYICYYGSGTLTQPIIKQWMPYYWCQIHAFLNVDYAMCLNDNVLHKHLNP